MRVAQKYAPKTLSEIVGQPAVVRRLQRLADNPYPCCVLCEGPGGVGKSATASALIHDLNVDSLMVESVSAPDLSIERVRMLFGHTFRLRPMFGNWHVLLIEEMELIVSRHVSAALKDNLSEQNMPPHLIVVATSNDASGLDEALLQRFLVFPFGSGPSFAESCEDRLRWIWSQEVGPDDPMPHSACDSGWRNNTYSMRRAIASLEAAVELHRERMVTI